MGCGSGLHLDPACGLRVQQWVSVLLLLLLMVFGCGSHHRSLGPRHMDSGGLLWFDMESGPHSTHKLNAGHDTMSIKE